MSRKEIGNVLYITSIDGYMIQCALCGEKWHDNWMDIDGLEICLGCYDVLEGTRCEICRDEFDFGITIQRYDNGFVHPECLEGRPIDHGD